MLARRIAPFFLLACVSWFTLQAGGLAAQDLGERGTPVSRPAAPFTETAARIVQRDRLLRRQRLAGRLPRGVMAPVPRQSEEARPLTPAGGNDEAPFIAPRDPAVRTNVGTLAQTVGFSFDGIGFQDQVSDLGKAAYPPDPSGAMGLDHFVLMTNNSVAFYNREGQRLFHVDADVFFSAGSFPRNGGLNPRVLYDRISGRWFATLIERGEPIFTGNNIGLAVSRTADPFGPWDRYVLPLAVPSAPGVSYYIDYATLGVDYWAVTLGYTVRASNGSGSTARIATTRRAPLVAESPSLGPVFVFSNLPDFHTAPLPAHNLDDDTRNTMIVGTPYQAFANIVFRSIGWNVLDNTPHLSVSGTVTTPGYVPPDFPPVFAQGSSVRVDVGDDRLQTAAIRNSRLWTCRTVGLGSAGTAAAPDRVGCEWLELQFQEIGSSSLTLRQSGRVFDSAAANARSYYYPSVMPTGQGHAAMGFSGARASEYIGIYAAGRLSADPLGTLGSLQTIKQGDGPYELLDSQGRNRWGDYSQTSLDPRDDMTLWTLQTYAAPQGAPFNGVVSRWKTRVAQIKAPAPTAAPLFVAALRDKIVSISLRGAGFYDPAELIFPNRLGLQVSGGVDGDHHVAVVEYIDPNEVYVTVKFATTAAPGPRDLTLINPDGQSVTLIGALNVVTIDFSADDYSSNEPAAGTSTVTIRVERSATAAAEVVQFATPLIAGGAGADDFEQVSGSLEFGSGEFNKTFEVTIKPDRLLEETEQFGLFLLQDDEQFATARVSIADNPAATAPGNLTATPIGSGRIDLAWTDRCDNETGFEIERKTGAGSFALLPSVGAGVASYTDTGVTGGAQYTYRVRAKKNALASSFSNEAAATTPSHPTTVQFQKAEFSGPEGGNVQVTLIRSGIVSGPSAVTVDLTPGAATAGVDYTGSGSTVIFNPEETSKTLSFPLLPDNLIEGDETVSLSLSSPLGAGLGARTTALMRITDDRAATAPANLQAQMDGALRMRLSWTDRSANETGFAVEAAQGQGEFALVAKVQETAFSMEAEPGIPHRVRVVAVRGSADASDPSPEVTFEVSFIGAAQITPPALAFGTVRVGRSKTLKLTIQNTARGRGADLWVTVGTLPAPYSVESGGGGFSLAPNKKRVVKVRYSPTSAGNVPPQSLRILTSDLPSRVVDIPITARGR